MGYVVVRVLSSVSPSPFHLARRLVCRAVLCSLLDSLFMGSRVMFAVIQENRLLGMGVAWQEDRHGRIDAAQAENTVNVPF